MKVNLVIGLSGMVSGFLMLDVFPVLAQTTPLENNFNQTQLETDSTADSTQIFMFEDDPSQATQLGNDLSIDLSDGRATEVEKPDVIRLPEDGTVIRPATPSSEQRLDLSVPLE